MSKRSATPMRRVRSVQFGTGLRQAGRFGRPLPDATTWRAHRGARRANQSLGRS